MFRGKEMRPPTVKMDPDFYSSGRNEEIMNKALRAKFAQDELAKKVLLLTDDAELYFHNSLTGEAEKADMLMKIREDLQNMENTINQKGGSESSISSDSSDSSDVSDSISISETNTESNLNQQQEDEVEEMNLYRD